MELEKILKFWTPLVQITIDINEMNVRIKSGPKRFRLVNFSSFQVLKFSTLTNGSGRNIKSCFATTTLEVLASAIVRIEWKQFSSFEFSCNACGSWKVFKFSTLTLAQHWLGYEVEYFFFHSTDIWMNLLKPSFVHKFWPVNLCLTPRFWHQH